MVGKLTVVILTKHELMKLKCMSCKPHSVRLAADRLHDLNSPTYLNKWIYTIINTIKLFHFQMFFDVLMSMVLWTELWFTNKN